MPVLWKLVSAWQRHNECWFWALASYVMAHIDGVFQNTPECFPLSECPNVHSCFTSLSVSLFVNAFLLSGVLLVRCYQGTATKGKKGVILFWFHTSWWFLIKTSFFSARSCKTFYNLSLIFLTKYASMHINTKNLHQMKNNHLQHVWILTSQHSLRCKDFKGNIDMWETTLHQ